MIGDIILQKRSGIIGYFVSFFTRSPYVHCGILVENVQIVHVDLWGKHTTPFYEWGDDVIVLTPVTPLSVSDSEYLRRCCRNEKVIGYSVWDAVKSWFWKSTDDNKPSGKRYQCAAFVSAMYRKIGIDLVPNRSDDTTQPQDFLSSPFLKEI